MSKIDGSNIINNMKLKLNNRDEEIASPKELLSVHELLRLKSFTFQDIIVIINGTIIPDEDYDIPQIKEADDVKMLHIFGGG